MLHAKSPKPEEQQSSSVLSVLGDIPTTVLFQISPLLLLIKEKPYLQ